MYHNVHIMKVESMNYLEERVVSYSSHTGGFSLGPTNPADAGTPPPRGVGAYHLGH